MNLSKVSQTAILTLVCRVVASENKDSVFNDPMAILCLENSYRGYRKKKKN